MIIRQSTFEKLMAFASGAILTTIESDLSVDFNYAGESYTLIGVCKKPIVINTTDDNEHYLEYDCSILLHRDMTYEIEVGVLLNRGLASYLREESISFHREKRSLQ